MQRWQLVGPRDRSSGVGRGWARGYPGQPRAHLKLDISRLYHRDWFHQHTSFCDLGEGQTGASLQVDVFGVYERAQGPKRLSGEEVCFSALCNGALAMRGTGSDQTLGRGASRPRSDLRVCDLRFPNTPEDPTPLLVHYRPTWSRKCRLENELHPGTL